MARALTQLYALGDDLAASEAGLTASGLQDVAAKLKEVSGREHVLEDVAAAKGAVDAAIQEQTALVSRLPESTKAEPHERSDATYASPLRLQKYRCVDPVQV